jgi:carboxyl-terminal processing protease
LIVDIRNNPGGTLESAVDVSDLFLDSGVIVSAKGRNNDLIFIHSANKTDILKGLPIAVIVNQYSASASEIFAGALQDNNRAILVGTATYGKGSIQSVIPLSDGGAIKLTTARYIRPSGAPINKLGIRPDILVKSTNGKEFSLTKRKDDHSNDIQLSEAINALNNNINYYH